MGKSHPFPDIRGILDILNAATDGKLNGLVDFSNLPAKHHEIERKYDLHTRGRTICESFMAFEGLVYELHRKRLISVESVQVFAGVDEYFLFGGNKRNLTFRLRLGSNRPYQLSVKLQMKEGENVKRAEFNIAVAHSDIQKMRASMTAISLIVPRQKHFLVGQSGQFWLVRDAQGRLVEIVAYQAGKPDLSPSHMLAEIEPREFETTEAAASMIADFERALGLRRRRLNLSLAEIFGP